MRLAQRLRAQPPAINAAPISRSRIALKPVMANGAVVLASVFTEVPGASVVPLVPGPEAPEPLPVLPEPEPPEPPLPPVWPIPPPESDAPAAGEAVRISGTIQAVAPTATPADTRLITCRLEMRAGESFTSFATFGASSVPIPLPPFCPSALGRFHRVCVPLWCNFRQSTRIKRHRVRIKTASLVAMCTPCDICGHRVNDGPKTA